LIREGLEAGFETEDDDRQRSEKAGPMYSKKGKENRAFFGRQGHKGVDSFMWSSHETYFYHRTVGNLVVVANFD
jgi:hypothetical protein